MITDDISSLAEALGQLLQAKNLSVTCAESCTGGGIGYAITSVAGSSNWFERGFITYSNEAKQALVGVKTKSLEKGGAVSASVVEEMAQGALANAEADIAVAVSGIAGPGGGTEEKPVGLVYFGIATKDEVNSHKKILTGDRNAVRNGTIIFALQLLIAKLEDAGI